MTGETIGLLILMMAGDTTRTAEAQDFSLGLFLVSPVTLPAFDLLCDNMPLMAEAQAEGGTLVRLYTLMALQTR